MKKVKILVFDTETTGLPKKYIPAEQDLDNYPNVLQLAGQLIEVDLDNIDNSKVLYSLNCLVNPYRNGKPVAIHPKAEAVHGISFEKAAAAGDDMFTVAMLHQGLCNSADFIVCHNYFFDKNVMASELLRLGIEPKYKKGAKVFCTMRYSTDLLKLPGKFGGQFKFPNLAELFNHLTGNDLSDHFEAHNAQGDVGATVVCLLELIKQRPEVQAWFKGEQEKIY